eukprot:s1258_g14.t1
MCLSDRHLEMLQSKGMQYDGGDVFGPDAHLSGCPSPPFAAENAQLLCPLLQINRKDCVRLDAMPLPVEFQGYAPCLQELWLGNGVEKSGQILVAASQLFGSALLKEVTYLTQKFIDVSLCKGLRKSYAAQPMQQPSLRWPQAKVS